MGAVIDDFYKSDAPQFKGKSKAKKRQMAIAAKLSKMDEAVHTFMTGHDVTFAGKKYDKIEIEVTGVDNVNKKYQVMLLAPKELFGKKTEISSKYMNRGPWTKTETPDVFEGETKDILQPPKIEIDDEILVGKFKNRKATVTGFDVDDNNQPVLKTTKGDQKLFKPRLVKLMKKEK